MVALGSKCAYGYSMTDEELIKRFDAIFENNSLTWEEQEEELKKLENLKKSDKITCKGVRKCLNDLNYTHYLDVLHNQTPLVVQNRGLQWHKNYMRRFSLLKVGACFNYYKRAILPPDGIQTTCLDKLK